MPYSPVRIQQPGKETITQVTSATAQRPEQKSNSILMGAGGTHYDTAQGLGRELWPIIQGRLVPQGKGKAKGVARDSCREPTVEFKCMKNR